MISDAEFAAWLSRDNSNRCVLVELDYQLEGGSPPTPATGTVYKSTRPYFGANNDSPPTVTAWDDSVASVPQYSRSLSGDSLGTYSSSIGTLELANADGRNDFILDLAIDGSEIRFYLGDLSWDRSDFRLIFSALSALATAPAFDRISITLKDTGLLLNQSIGGTIKVGGTGPNADKWRPVNFGLVHQIECQVLDQATLGYVHSDTGDGLVIATGLYAETVRDRAISVGFVDNGDGTINLTQSPDGTITADVLYTAGNDDWFCVSDAIKHFVGDRLGLIDAGLYAGPGPTYDTRPDTGIAAFLAAGGEDYKVGISLPEKRNVNDLLGELTDSGLCFVAIRRDGKFTFGRLRPNYISGLGIASSKTLTRDDFDPGTFKQDRITPNYFQFQATMSRNWSIQTDLATSLSPDERAKFTRTGLYAIQNDGIGLDYENAPQLYNKTLVESPQIDTLLSGDDDASDQVELQQWMDVRRAAQLPWLTVASGTVGIDAYAIELGDIVTLEMPRFGYDDGADFQAISVNIKLPNKVDLKLLRRDVQRPYGARASRPPDIAPYAGPARTFTVLAQFIAGQAYATGVGAGLAIAVQWDVIAEFIPGAASGKIEGDAGGGTVTSVALSVPSEFSVGGSPVINAGTLAVSWANPVSIAHGGTSAATALQAFTNLSPQTTKGDLVADNGTNPVRLPVSANDGWAVVSDSNQSAGLNYAPLGAVGIDFYYYGDGSDGDVTVSTAIILTRDMFYHNLTITSSGSINTKGWRVHCSGILDVTAALASAIAWPTAAGGAGGLGSGGAAGAAVAGNTVGNGQSGSAGGTPGSTNPGVTTGASPSLTNSAGGIGGRGSTGGVGTGAAAGGTGGTPGTITNLTHLHMLVHDLFVAMTASIITGGIGGTGGGGGTGNGSGFGGGGGGGACGGNVVAVFARTIARSSSGPVGIINANGGLGGAGFSPATVGGGGGGAGAGGGGGYMYLVYSYVTGTACTNMVTCNGGLGGAGGNGNAGGAGADGGAGGTAGRLMAFNLSAGTLQELLTPAAGSAGSLHSGTAGGAGGPGGLAQVTI